MWIVSVHNCGGSMAEAAEPTHEWSFPGGQADAHSFAAMLQSFLGDDWLVLAREILSIGAYQLPKATGAALAALGQAQPGQFPLDIQKVAQIIEQGGDFRLRPPDPPPVDPDEEAAAIQSILGSKP